MGTSEAWHWWENAQQNFNDSEWSKHFRMRRAPFNFSVAKLGPHIRHDDTRMRSAISQEKRVAIALWRLGTPDAFRTISEIFGVGISTVYKLTREVCLAIEQHLQRTYISFPEGNVLQDVISGFEEKWNFPQCVGAVDGPHIEINAPLENAIDYVNQKGYHSIILQALDDDKCL